MSATLFTDAEQIYFDYDITIIRNIKNQHQRPYIDSICKKIDFLDISKEFLNI